MHLCADQQLLLLIYLYEKNGSSVTEHW